jgi:hypothetical protein
MSDNPFAVIRWSELSPVITTGETGTVTERVAEVGGLRTRLVEFSANYRANHWCSRGHIVFVLEGTLVTDLADGRRVETPAGTGFQVGDGEPAHRSSADSGATVFIVDQMGE